jgi:PKD repeat protein
MKQGHTHSLRQFALLLIVLCSSYFVKANCLTSAQWTYTSPSGDSIAFASVDTNVGVHHLWTFGDGSIDSTTSPGHRYASPGVYQVCQYTYFGSYSCPDTFCQSIVVGDTCRITAAWTPTALGGDSIRFTAADTFSTATHIWNFGDGNYAYGTTLVTHHYASSGNYQVCFYVSRPGTSCSDSLCQTVTVTDNTCGLSAEWSDTARGGDTVQFIAINNSSFLSYQWTFGDDSTATAISNPIHTYAASGFYNVCLHIGLTVAGCYDSVCQKISAGSNPCGITANWTYFSNGGDSVKLFATDTNSLATHQWSFGDGTFVSGVTNTSHHYTEPGIYHVCFYVYIPNTACSDSFCQDVSVSHDTCGLTPVWYSYSLGGDSIRLTPADTSSLVYHIWTFGDGVTAFGTIDTVHNYSTAGIYTVCLTVNTAAPGCSDSLCRAVTVGTPPCPITATWTSYNLGGDSVSFYATDTVSAATHVWNFGDGTFAYGTTAVTHTYAFAGPYHVCFYAYELGTSCSDSLCQDITINIDTCHITSYWTSTVLGGDSVKFAAADTNTVATHIWNFGDGSSLLDTAQTNHIYAASGVYTVCLYVSKPGTACSDSLCQQVTVTATVPCTTSAAWTSVSVGNDSTRFIASDTISGTQYIWSFGDGSPTSTIGNVIHHYSSAGTYTACLTVYTTSPACIDSFCQSVTVTGSVPCNITAAWTSTIVGNDSVSFSASDTNSASHYVWSFGDGNTGTSKNILHHYASSGTYDVCLIVYKPSTNCYDTLCRNVVVTGTLLCTTTAAWAYTIVSTSLTGIDSVQFIAADTNTAATHIWNFGDGSTTVNATNIIHQFDTFGTYHVCLYVAIPGTNCADTFCQDISFTLICPITPAWTSIYLGGDSVSFTAVDSNVAASHNWDLGDGTTIPGQTQFTHTYSTPGAYYVCFYVYISGTPCLDSLCQTVNIPLGINELSDMPNITVMPNPFSQYTVIKVDGSNEAYELYVYDVVGKAVKHLTSSDNTFNLERENLASGMYMYEVMLKGELIGKGKIVAE